MSPLPPPFPTPLATVLRRGPYVTYNKTHPLYCTMKAERKARLAVVVGWMTADVDGHWNVEFSQLAG